MLTYLRRKMTSARRKFWKVRPDRPTHYFLEEGAKFRNGSLPVFIWVLTLSAVIVSIFTAFWVTGFALFFGTLAVYVRRRWWRLPTKASSLSQRCEELHEEIFEKQSNIESLALAKELRHLPQVKTLIKTSRKAERELLKALRKLEKDTSQSSRAERETLGCFIEGAKIFSNVENELKLLLAENSRAFKENPEVAHWASAALSSMSAFKEASSPLLEQRIFIERAKAELSGEEALRREASSRTPKGAGAVPTVKIAKPSRPVSHLELRSLHEEDINL